jgi:AraC family transcriptional regulator, positive regulator of tynA and feaB
MDQHCSEPSSPTHRCFTSPEDWLCAIEPHFAGSRYARRRQPFSLWARKEKLGESLLLDSHFTKSGLDDGREVYGFSVEAVEAGPCFILLQQVGYARVKQADRAMELRSGEWAIFDARIPTSFLVPDGSRTIGLTVARAHYEWLRRFQPGGARLDRSAASCIALAMISEALRCSEWPGAQLQALMEAVLVDAVEASLPAPASERSPLARDGVKLDRARQAIEAHLTDPDLNPDVIGRAVGLSRRSLYRLLRQIGQTPMGFVHELRLSKAARLLRDRTAENRSVTNVSYAVGFVDPTHFSRLFRARYGMSPKQWTESRSTAVAPAHR